MRSFSVLCLLMLFVAAMGECKALSWTPTSSEKVDVMDVDQYDLVILDPDYYIRVFNFRERGIVPIAYFDLHEDNIKDPQFLKSLIEEQIPEVLHKRFLGICFINLPLTKSGIIKLYKSVSYQYPEMKLVAVYDQDTINEIAPFISYVITPKEYFSSVEALGVVVLPGVL